MSWRSPTTPSSAWPRYCKVRCSRVSYLLGQSVSGPKIGSEKHFFRGRIRNPKLVLHGSIFRTSLSKKEIFGWDCDYFFSYGHGVQRHDRLVSSELMCLRRLFGFVCLISLSCRMLSLGVLGGRVATVLTCFVTASLIFATGSRSDPNWLIFGSKKHLKIRLVATAHASAGGMLQVTEIEHTLVKKLFRSGCCEPINRSWRLCAPRFLLRFDRSI